MAKSKKTLFWTSLLTLGLIFASISIVKGSPTYEDFTTYTEVEPDDRIQKTANHIDFHAYRNEDAYVYKDRGVGHFTNFEHLIDVKFSITTSDHNIFACWALTNELDDMKGLRDASKTAIWVAWVDQPIAENRKILLKEEYEGLSYTDTYIPALRNTWYYLLIKKVGTAFTCKIYDTAESRDAETSDEHLLYTLSLTLQADHSFRYVMPCCTFNDGFNEAGTNDIENLDLQEEFTVTFYNNSGGILKVNGTTISNETSKVYTPNQVIELSGLPVNSSYRFQNFTWDSNYNKTNPYNLTITTHLTVWCYFHKPSTFNVGFALGFLLMLMVGLILALTLSSKRSKH